MPLEENKERYRWVILGVVYLAVLSFAITLQSVPPILPLMIAELNLSHAQAGLLMSLFSLPAVLIAIPAGILADRHGQKVIGIVCFILMIIGAVLFSYADAVPLLAISRIISGMGAMTIFVISPQIIAQWFTGGRMGIAMGVFNTGMPLGTILSLNLLSMLGESLGWRVSMLSSAIIPLAALVIFFLFYTQAPQMNGEVSSLPEDFFKSIRTLGMSIWLIGIAWMFFNAAALSMFTFTPDLLKREGFSITTAGFLTSLVMWPQLVWNLIVGFAIDRIDRKRSMIAIGGIGFAILLWIVPFSIGWVTGIMILVGLAMGLIPPPIFALAPEVVSADKLGFGYGVMASLQNIGILMAPPIAGLIKDLTGSYQGSYGVMSAFALIVTISIILLGIKHRIIPNS